MKDKAPVEKKHIYISPRVHNLLAKAANKYSRKVNLGLADEVIIYGIEHFESMQKKISR